MAFIIYFVLRFIEGTRAVQMIFGLLSLVIIYFLSQNFDLFTINWLLGNFLSFIILIAVILFQHDLRRVLAAIGRSPFLLHFNPIKSNKNIVDEIVKSASYLSNNKLGGLIAIERNNNLGDFVEIGTEIDAILSTELIISIFNPISPLHDGAVILSNDKIISAGSFFPLATDPDLDKDLGTRHRAAIGVTRETDCVVVIVSEETSKISVAYHGELIRGLDAASLNQKLLEILELAK
ncbi:MAG: TIGR00159 family protein [Candidatus Dadabacteria bacterium]|nr:TIGR00159 family protein [Candidatus Dadabacteria bacterium]NIS07823.1 TIGR00159 family protein [Candidatus Dadabacteria bacterium]NIX14842.1 TIGR00159 family protein [Candidatus Dadabacteria bacterium]NIY21442.1 TIGR00159 family protein [Candidatus Dadabacteria bacterium]